MRGGEGGLIAVSLDRSCDCFRVAQCHLGNMFRRRQFPEGLLSLLGNVPRGGGVFVMTKELGIITVQTLVLV